VVDASGQSALLARKLGLRDVDPKLRHASIYTRYRGGRRGTGRDEGATLIFWTRSRRSWFWFIPLPDDRVSVGVVGPIDRLITAREGMSPEQIYREELEDCPALAERLAGAVPVRPIAVIRDFSYLSRRIAGDGWVLAGDAFGFLDPMYSTGVFFALHSAELAADAIHEGLQRGDVSARRLGAHGNRFVAGMEAMRRLVYAYYDEGFHFGRFLEHHPDCREPLVNLLVGNVFRKDTARLFDALGTMTELPEVRTID
jgi:flavin-dependent dehydrogenase